MSRVLGLATAAAVAFCAAPVLALPSGHVQATGESGIQLVAGGCGRGVQPNWRGDCTRSSHDYDPRRGDGGGSGHHDWHGGSHSSYHQGGYYQPRYSGYYQPRYSGYYQAPYYAPPAYYYPAPVPAPSYYYSYGW